MNTDSLLKLSKRHRNSVLSVLCLLLVLTTVAFLAVSGSFLQTALSFLQFVGSALVAILFAYLVFTTLVSKGEAGLFELQPREITKEFEELLKDSRSWRYKGNFGRYLRGKVLPTLCASGAGGTVMACIIDPTIHDLCVAHASYRGRINSIDKGMAHTGQTVALQVLVTVVLCAWYKANKGLDLRVYLAKTYDPIRIDASDSSMIVTVEDRRSPALKVNKGHFMFDHFDLQMTTAREQGRLIDLSGMSICEITNISESDVDQVLRSSALFGLIGNITLAAVVQGCREAKNPYEN